MAEETTESVDPNEGKRASAPERHDQTKAAFASGERPGVDDEGKLRSANSGGDEEGEKKAKKKH